MRGKITELLGPAPIRIDDLVEQAEAPLQSEHLFLLELELAGRLTYDSGGQVVWISMIRPAFGRHVEKAHLTWATELTISCAHSKSDFGIPHGSRHC